MTELKRNQGNIPVIFVSGENLPEAWEKAMLAVWNHGVDILTEYEYPDSPPMSKDATVMVEVSNPFNEPRIHKNFPGGPEDLERYRQEVVNGIHDHWIAPEEDKWAYTYHDRLCNYKGIDQIEYIINKLIDAYYSRRAQAITWIPTIDTQTYDIPCLQRIWCRLLPDKNDNLVLNMNTHWRSRDLYGAWFMNSYAITDLQRVIAERISAGLKQVEKSRFIGEIKIGRYMDISDSLHIYGKDFDRVAPEIEKMQSSSYRERTWKSTHPAFAAITEETREKLRQDPDFMLKIPTKAGITNKP
jgi:thymidylate synthase